MTGYAKPSHTQVPNFLLDSHMSEMGEAELKVVLAVTRKTLGWHKKRDRLSFSQLVEITGLSRQGVADGTAAAIQRGVVARYPVGNSYEYELVVSEVDQSEMVSETDQSGQPSRPETQKNGQPSRHTKENKLKETSQKKDSDTPSDFWEKELSPTQELTRVPFGEEFEEPKRKIPPSQTKPMQKALARVMGYDLKIGSNYSRTGRLAKELLRADYTPEQIESIYGPGGAWFREDWRGKKGELPNMASIAQTVGMLAQGKSLSKREDAKSRYERRIRELADGN